MIVKGLNCDSTSYEGKPYRHRARALQKLMSTTFTVFNQRKQILVASKALMKHFIKCENFTFSVHV